MEFNTEFLLFSILGASIYRLTVQMSVWLDKTGRRPDGGHRPSGRTTVRPKFWKFRWRSFLFEGRVRTVRHCRPDSRTSAASNFHIEASRVQTGGTVVRTADLMQAISISDACASGPWWQVSGRLDLNCNTCLMDERVRMGYHVVRKVAAIFPYLCLERNLEAWSNTEDRPDGMLNRPDGCKLEQFEASQHRGRSGRESTLSGRMML
jgi:hypothetical protein